MKKKKANGRVGASGPGTRICLIAGSTRPKHLKMSLYTMDLSPFKVEKKEENCSSCYKVNLYGGGGHKIREEEEHLMVDPYVLAGRHRHDDDAPPCRPVFVSGCKYSSFAALDKSTVFCVSYCPYVKDDHGTETLVEKIKLDEDGGVADKEKCPSPSFPRHQPQMLVLDGKLYVFGGGQVEEEESEGVEEESEGVEYPWSEVFDPVTGEWDHCAGSRTGWKPLVRCPYINSGCVEPVLVGSTIYWLDKAICAYDIKKDAYFKGYFPSYDLSILIENTESDHYRLLHIGGDAEDVFCLVRPDPYCCHFMRVRITKDYNSFTPGNYSPAKIQTYIISCSSKNIQQVDYISHVFLQDIFVGGKKKMKLESASAEMPNKDVSGSEAIGASVLIRCNKRSADSVIYLSTEDGSSDSEVTRSKKIKVCSKISLPFEKDASDSKVSGFPGVLKRCSSRGADPEKPFPKK